MNLKNVLPHYMIPSGVMILDKLPTNNNGKVDKKALPVIELKSEKDYVEPTNAVEKAICDAFSEALKVSKVGIDDSFYELGGDSLKIIRVRDILNNNGISIPIVDFIKYLTPRLIAEQHIINDNISVVSRINYNRSIEADIEDIHIGQILDSIKGYNNNHYIVEKEYVPLNIQKIGLYNPEQNVISGTLEIDGEGDVERIVDALNSVIKSQGVLRTKYDSEVGRLLQCKYERFSIPIIDLMTDDASHVIEQTIALSKNVSLIGKDEWLAKFAILKVSKRKYTVIYFIQHSIWDQMSSFVLAEMLEKTINNNEDHCMYEEYANYIISHNDISDCNLDEIYNNDLVKRFCELIRNRNNNYQNSYNVRGCIKISNRIITLMKETPFETILELYGNIKNQGGDCPFVILENNRNDKNINTLGMFLDFVPAIYKADKHAVIKPELHTNVLFSQISNIWNDIGNCISINFGGIYEYDGELAENIIIEQCDNIGVSDSIRCDISGDYLIIDMNVSCKDSESLKHCIYDYFD